MLIITFTIAITITITITIPMIACMTTISLFYYIAYYGII